MLHKIFGIPFSEKSLTLPEGELWPFSLPYNVTQQIFARHLNLFDLFGNARAVSKAWRWMTSEENVTKLALRSLGFHISRDIVPLVFFQQWALGISWIQQPKIVQDENAAKTLFNDLIDIAVHDPNLFSDFHMEFLKQQYEMEKLFPLFLMLLNRSEAKDGDFDWCLKYLRTHHAISWLTFETNDSPGNHLFYFLLDHLPLFFKKYEDDPETIQFLLRLLANSQVILPHRDEDEKVNYLDSGRWVKVRDLRNAHSIRWQNALRHVIEVIENLMTREAFHEKWPHLFPN